MLGSDTCPESGLKLVRPVVLHADMPLRIRIHEWAENNALWLLVSRAPADAWLSVKHLLEYCCSKTVVVLPVHIVKIVVLP